MFKKEFLYRLKTLIRFSKCTLDKENFFKSLDKQGVEAVKKSKKVRINELKKTDVYDHEIAHLTEWQKYGFNSEVYQRLDNGLFFTIPSDFPEKARDLKKETIVEILKAVLIAPFKKGARIGIADDVICYEALSGNIKENSLERDVLRIKRKYKLR